MTRSVIALTDVRARGASYPFLHEFADELGSSLVEMLIYLAEVAIEIIGGLSRSQRHRSLSSP